MATKKRQRMFVAVNASSTLHCYITVDQAVEGARKWFEGNGGAEDVMIYEVVPVKRVSRDIGVTVKAPGAITITKKD